jgi:hypothetical protein
VLHSLSINYPMLYKFEAMVGLGGGYNCGSYGLMGRSGFGSTSCSAGGGRGRAGGTHSGKRRPDSDRTGGGLGAGEAVGHIGWQLQTSDGSGWRSSDGGWWSSEWRWSSSSEWWRTVVL